MRILAYGVWIVEEAFVLGLGFGWVVVVGIVVGCRVTCCCSSVAVHEGAECVTNITNNYDSVSVATSAEVERTGCGAAVAQF